MENSNYYEEIIQGERHPKNATEKIISKTKEKAGMVLAYLGTEHPAFETVFKYFIAQDYPNLRQRLYFPHKYHSESEKPEELCNILSEPIKPFEPATQKQEVNVNLTYGATATDIKKAIEKCRIPSEPYLDNGIADIDKIGRNISSDIAERLKSLNLTEPIQQEKLDIPVKTDEPLRITFARIFGKQMKLLSIRSEKCSDEYLADITNAMTSIAQVFVS